MILLYLGQIKILIPNLLWKQPQMKFKMLLITIGSYTGVTFNKDMTPEELEKATEAKRMNKF